MIKAFFYSLSAKQQKILRIHLERSIRSDRAYLRRSMHTHPYDGSWYRCMTKYRQFLAEELAWLKDTRRAKHD